MYRVLRMSGSVMHVNGMSGALTQITVNNTYAVFMMCWALF